jgi:hypothetical protein
LGTVAEKQSCMLRKLLSAGQPLNSSTARNCFIANQLATPGLGSLMGGRYRAGAGQLGLALAGFALVLAWFALTLREYYRMSDMFYSSATPKSYGALGAAGGVVFVSAWLWALATSLSLLREAKRNEALHPPAIPPPAPKPPAGSDR